MTLLSHIDVCPYSGALYLRERERGTKQTHPMARGEVTHEAIEWCLKEFVLGEGEQMIPPEVAKEIAQETMEKRVDLALNADEQEAVRTALWNWAKASVFDRDVIVGVEVMLELELAGWTIRGKLDLCEIVNRVGVVTDWKTNLNLPSREEYERNFQAQMYALLLFEGTVEGETAPLGTGLSGIQTFQKFPRLDPDKNDGALFFRDAFYEPHQLVDFKRVLEGHLKKLEHGLETNQWAATDGSWCARCPAQKDCPIPASQREARTIGSPGEALEVAEHVNRTEANVKTDKKAVKDYLAEQGLELIVGDKVWKFKTQRRETVDKPAVKALIEQHGLKVEDYFKESTSTPFVQEKIKEEKAA